ncbi:efflux RND transporter periplasmic adaptor subunit [Serratia fonticola]|uniref:efflux RND transporter periplasmic adaptor subunit n=1 Tax=Serratia fonticola TaxID=47917 RepID=UPI003AACCC55
MDNHKKSALFGCIIGLSITIAISGCNDTQSPSQKKPTTQVGVITIKGITLPITTELPGRTSAYRVAEVRPQVGGILLHRQFVEGSDVKSGDSLYQIDPATYQANYDQAKGELAKSVAAANIAHLTVARYTSLLSKKYVSQQDYDTAVANAKQADATVLASKASVENARINLKYTQVLSPISGRTGKSSVTEGALLTTDQANALVTVQQLDPIYVDVTQSSNDFLRLKQSVMAGDLQKSPQNGQVTLLLDNGKPYALPGRLEFSDVTVDENTGSITLRALFPNPQHDLLPGMFVRAKIDEGVRHNALLVPQEGVTRNPRGDATVMLVDAKNIVQVKKVNAQQAIGDRWLVTDGIQEGDRVIISGLQKIKPGMKVNAEEATNK